MKINIINKSKPIIPVYPEEPETSDNIKAFHSEETRFRLMVKGKGGFGYTGKR